MAVGDELEAEAGGEGGDEIGVEVGDVVVLRQASRVQQAIAALHCCFFRSIYILEAKNGAPCAL